MNKFEKEKGRLVAALLKDLSEKNLAVFAGAGLSAPAGFVSWSKLLEPIAEELDLDIKKETDLVALAQYHCNRNLANRGKLNQLLINELSKNARPTINHQILARLPISTYWTTNYDKLIEQSITDAGKIADTKFRTKQLNYTKPGRHAVVYKMHGDIEHPDEAILTKDDYESYHIKMQPFINALSGDLVSKTFLFVGFSFTDPNLDYILSRVRTAYSNDQRQHYCIQRAVKQVDGESEADSEYRARKQELFIQDLLRFGIKTLLVDEYSEITEVLVELEWAYKRNTIFISGAAHDFGRFEKSEAESFIYSLSKDIAALGFRIVSGFGLGVGSSVITGVLDHIYMNGNRLDSDQLILRPFPQNQVGTRSIAEVWAEYRNDMISYAGIAIFLFGNKIQDDQVVNSDGMLREFEIAKAKGLLLIPIGSTGYAAKVIFKLLEDAGYFHLSSFPQQLRIAIEALNDENLELPKARELVVSMLKQLNT